ncbi:MAG: YdcF family protein [Gammaproteobacteria bacterium]|nr:YdcF family protein [Gammaproteobacteria bacterium]MDH5800327.1 YdcF family protein [Gammaproteobacteria bacterium]
MSAKQYPAETVNVQTAQCKMRESQSINTNAAPIGGDGYFTLGLSNLFVFATGGLSLLWFLRDVIQFATKTPASSNNCDVITVLGMRLEENQPGRDFISRLERARTLFETGSANTILILGGKTGNSIKSEAQSGLEYLSNSGIGSEFIVTEDQSRHTLENLSNARTIYLGKNEKRTTIITSRFHLARAHIMAKGLQLQHCMCAAEEHFLFNPKNLIRACVEAYFIHWYYTGKLWAHCIRSEKSLSRIR